MDWNRATSHFQHADNRKNTYNSLSIKGSYVISLPDGCKLRINSTILQSYQNPEFKKQSIQTPKLEISSNRKKKSGNKKPYNSKHSTWQTSTQFTTGCTRYNRVSKKRTIDTSHIPLMFGQF
ncbi:hypothetical protein Zmor_001140 [Zophobas morio]|uniref:Uncharacterized protein n=1 Tax=Zophobas morio TaxID=2755281 RepID=A0AA38IYN8_9CUCU|nr:hypothetical protein Zmor_001140 [Zophobas morio]